MKSFIKKLLPKKYKKQLYNHYNGVFKQKALDRYAWFEKITTVHELADRHLRNLKAIPSRREMLSIFPQNGVVAEIGVDEGNFSEEIIAQNKPAKLHLIDVWGTERYNKQKQRGVEEKLTRQISEGMVDINVGYSNEVVTIFPDSYFDWIYIDTSHSYGGTKEELELYAPKMKPHGIIRGMIILSAIGRER